MKVAKMGLAACVLLFASCGNPGGNPSGNHQPQTAAPMTILYLTASNEDQGSSKIISELAREYEQQHPQVDYKFESVRDSDLSEKIQLLAASNDLPVIFGYQSGRPLLDFIHSDAVLDLEQTFKQLGIYDKLNPSAVQWLKKYVDNTGLYALPLEMNIEGFWYNKEIFTRLNLTEPKTWDEMIAAAEKIKQAGIQPFAVSGKAKWPITRLINGYIIRKLGADAMEQVEKGKLDITDPGFVEAADAVQKMGLSGYFGPNVNAVDIGASYDLFVQGEAAMFYSGSWSIRDFNNPALNPIGPENTGFFSIPLVEGGVGSLDDYPVNAGLTTSFSQEAYNGEVGQWMKYVFERYGDRAMSELGMITGFKVEEVPEEVPPLTRMVQGKLDGVKNGALWFEARFNTRTQLLAWENAQLLVTDPSFTPAEYMQQLKQAISGQ
ncbi:ABC transporter substrate-binding protein [Cohnella mopanensis]|uniref:ABC transporter substrate-binding protein n=1 Tax=Cohnella mopanensis TaxID=2911966 RepID=UPI001EF96CD9|nr:extracellular solute-binding protein [Cohnella mopanensis]